MSLLIRGYKVVKQQKVVEGRMTHEEVLGQWRGEQVLN